MGSEFSDWWVMSNYRDMARQAARRERAGDWAEAEALWARAAEQAFRLENRAWATSRAAFCRKSEVHQRAPSMGEASV